MYIKGERVGKTIIYLNHLYFGCQKDEFCVIGGVASRRDLINISLLVGRRVRKSKIYLD